MYQCYTGIPCLGTLWLVSIWIPHCRGGVAGPAGPRPDHISVDRWSRSQTAETVWGWDDCARCPTQARLWRLCPACMRFSYIIIHTLIFCRRIRSLARPDRTASAPTHFDSTGSFHRRTLPVVDPPPRTCTSDLLFAVASPPLKCRRRLCIVIFSLQLFAIIKYKVCWTYLYAVFAIQQSMCTYIITAAETQL